jgi:hypothetical protein
MRDICMKRTRVETRDEKQDDKATARGHEHEDKDEQTHIYV